MTDRDRDALDPDALGLAADAAALCDEVAAGSVPPGLADVIRRAADDVPDLDTREEADLAAALDALPEQTETAAFGGLADFLDAARGQADAYTEARARSPIPAMPRPAARSRRAPIAIVFAAAAVLLLVPLLWAGLASTRLDAAPSVDTSGEAALQSLERDDASAAVVERTAPRSVPKPIVSEPAPVPEVAPEEEPILEEVVPEPERKRPALAERLVVLDAEARAAWKAGDLGLAEDKFREIVRVGRRGKTADLAYGDLFSIARQRADEPGLRRYWKQYAAKFPRGRWIDDARAGLCRTASVGEREACWRKYLADRPNGTYRRDAEAALR